MSKTDPNFKGSQAFYKKFQKKIKFQAKDINPNSQVILSAGNFNRYLELSSHQELIDISNEYGEDNCLCESRQNCKMANLFFDFDCKDNHHTHAQGQDVIKSLKSKISYIFPSLNIKFYVKESQEYSGCINSMHIVCHLKTTDGQSIYFDYSNGCSQIKHFVSKLHLEHPFDHKQAYSGHLLRLIHSNKFNKDGSPTDRILDHSTFYSEFRDPLYSLSSYCPNPNYMLVTDYVNKHFILEYVRNHEYTKNYLFKDIIQRANEQHLSLTLTEQRTPVCEHRSNNAVCMFFHQDSNPNIIIKCQDAECGKFFQTYFRYDDNTHRCQITATGDNSSERQSSQRSSETGSTSPNSKKKKQKQITDLDHIQQFVANMSQFLPSETAFSLQKLLSIQPNSATLLGQPPQHNETLSLILGSDIRQFQCSDNQLTYQHNGRLNVIELWSEMVEILKKIEKKHSEKQLEKQNIIYNNGQYVEHLHQQIINNYNSPNTDKDETVYDDGFEDIQFDTEQHKECFISIINDDFQFITELYNLQYPDQFIYVYDEKDNGCTMFFDDLDETRKNKTNGGYWNMQGGLKVAKQHIRNYVVKFFNSILKQFQPKDPRRKVVQFKLKSVRGVFKNNTELDQYLMETYFNKKIKFNNYPYYLHFQNGTFDLNQRRLIKTTPEMYNTFQIDYDYDESIPYDDIYQSLSQIMQIDEFEWFLKQLSNCLNPRKVIEEKQIVILTGFGNNGKTILFNLINHTFGLEAYSTSGRSLMIQAPNTTSSSATPDQAKLLYKRFCYIAELDKKLSFNQQAVKVLTGGEEIQARDLYKSLITFQPGAGLFVSCNQIPCIDTSDGGFINRLKIIDLKYQFEENPSHQFQRKVNRELHHLVKSTEWKQGFMNLLIQYYYKNRFSLPLSIKNSIDIRINLQQSPLHLWAIDNIKYCQNSFFLSEDANNKYADDTDNKIKVKTFNNQINEFFQQYLNIYNNVTFKKKIDKIVNGTRFQGTGFYNCVLRQDEDSDSKSE